MAILKKRRSRDVICDDVIKFPRWSNYSEEGERITLSMGEGTDVTLSMTMPEAKELTLNLIKVIFDQTRSGE